MMDEIDDWLSAASSEPTPAADVPADGAAANEASKPIELPPIKWARPPPQVASSPVPFWESEPPHPWPPSDSCPSNLPTRASLTNSPIMESSETTEAPKKSVFEHPKQRVYTHWARPTFLQYEYLYHYMHNYYDDVIDYLDKRQRGLEVEPPRPQTWAERALRTYTRNTYPQSLTWKLPRMHKPDAALLHTSHWAHTWHNTHSKDFYNRKYKAILF